MTHCLKLSGVPARSGFLKLLAFLSSTGLTPSALLSGLNDL